MLGSLASGKRILENGKLIKQTKPDLLTSWIADNRVLEAKSFADTGRLHWSCSEEVFQFRLRRMYPVGEFVVAIFTLKEHTHRIRGYAPAACRGTRD